MSRQDYEYKGKHTAWNGIHNYLENKYRGDCFSRREADKRAANTDEMIREFLKSEGLNIASMPTNAMKVQKRFSKFKHFVEQYTSKS